jgi:hypothetical protein
MACKHFVLIDLKQCIERIDAAAGKLVSIRSEFKKKMAERTGVEPA